MAADNAGATSKLSEAIGAAVHRAAVAAAPHLQAAHDERVTAFLEGLEARVAPLLAPLLAEAIANPETPAEVAAILDVVANPTHKFDSSLIGIGLAAILYPFIQAGVAPIVQDVQSAAWTARPTVPLSPAEVALAKLRNNPYVTDPYGEAAKSGAGTHHLDALEYNTGEPPGITELLLLYRRGQIDLARLTTGVRQSRIRDEWLPEIEELRYAPPPAGEVLAGAVQNHLSLADAQTKIAEAGIDPANFQWMYETHGRPPSPLEVARLVHRGLATMADFDQAVAESDIKNKYTQMIFESATYIPPVRSIIAMLRAGAIDDSQATTLLTENGVRASDIPGYLAEAHHTTASKAKELTEAQTLRMYEARFIDRNAATLRLEKLQLPADVITLLLDFADEAARERYVNAVVTRVHARYVAWKMTDTQATNTLNADGIPAAAITQYLQLWKLERDANVRVMTPAAVVGAYRRQIISAADTKARLLSLGVQPADLAIVVADGWPPTKVDPAAVLAVVNA